MYCFKLVNVLLLLLITEYVSCDCGPPGIPFGAEISRNSSISREGDIVLYKCKNKLKLVYGDERNCNNSKWSGRVPKCGKNLIMRVIKSKNSSDDLFLNSFIFKR